ncbi:hypothetical protein KP509_22G047700 [Ceratopteris richardii]|uniref:Uncharacterized protein n=1 Tax=Ceratopteris richardii TaxID=49495 RepID=A0A8T2S7J6_CERRI|nr:hypothetical protein KP509_22G047700 [Ceratopteris richardii]
MAGSSDSSHLMHIKKLEGAHNFAVWQKQCYNILLQKKQAKPIKAKGVKPADVEQDDWDELNELARSTIELSQNVPAVQQQIPAVNEPANAEIYAENDQPDIAHNDEPLNVQEQP